MLTFDLKIDWPSSSSSKMKSAAASRERRGPFDRKSLMKIKVSTPRDLCLLVFIEIKFAVISSSIRLSEH
jgi:hypothetical protein